MTVVRLCIQTSYGCGIRPIRSLVKVLRLNDNKLAYAAVRIQNLKIQNNIILNILKVILTPGLPEERPFTSFKKIILVNFTKKNFQKVIFFGNLQIIR